MDETSLAIVVGVVAVVGLLLWILRGKPRGGGGGAPPYADGSIGDGGAHDHGGGAGGG
jgi:hypothetical protein